MYCTIHRDSFRAWLEKSKQWPLSDGCLLAKWFESEPQARGRLERRLETEKIKYSDERLLKSDIATTRQEIDRQRALMNMPQKYQTPQLTSIPPISNESSAAQADIKEEAAQPASTTGGRLVVCVEQHDKTVTAPQIKLIFYKLTNEQWRGHFTREKNNGLDAARVGPKRKPSYLLETVCDWLIKTGRYTPAEIQESIKKYQEPEKPVEKPSKAGKKKPDLAAGLKALMPKK